MPPLGLTSRPLTGPSLRTLLFAALLFAVACSGWAQAGSPAAHSLTTDEIVARLVQRNQARAALLKHYESCRYYSVDYIGFPSEKSAAMVVDMSYDAPAQKQFRIMKEQGSRLLLDHVLSELIQEEKEALSKENLGKADLTPANYDFQLVGTDTISARPQYVLDVSPRYKSKFLYHGRIWVDSSDFAVSRLQAQPSKNVSFWVSHTEIQHEYKKIGDFWLPAQNTSITHVRFGGTAKLKIDYRDYRIGEPPPGTGSDVCAGTSQIQVSQKR